MSDKQDAINKSCFDRSGFSVKGITLQYARRKNKTIKMSDIDELFKTNVEQENQLRGCHVVVALDAYYQHKTVFRLMI